MNSIFFSVPRRIAGRRLLAGLFAALLIPVAAQAHEYYGQGFTLVHPWAEPAPDGAIQTPVYFSVQNITAGDRLTAVQAPWAASGELRTGDGVVVPEATGLPFAPGPDRKFVAGQPHVLLKGLTSPLQAGRSYGMTFIFEKTGPVNVMVSVGAH